MKKDKKDTKYIEGVRVDFGLSEKDFLGLIYKGVEEKLDSNYICTVNPEFIMKAQEDDEFKDAINSSYLSVPDGVGVLMAYKYLKSIENISRKNILSPVLYFLKGIKVGVKSVFKTRYLGQRLAGSSLIFKMCEIAESNGWTVFLLGGWEKDKLGRMKSSSGEISKKAANKLKQKYPDLRIIGTTSEFSGKKEDDETTIKYMKRKMVKNSAEKIDLVFVGYAFGEQEKWLKRNLSKLPAKVGIGIGGTFDQITGYQRRSPKLFVNLHLEWLFRLITQPWRIKRVLTAFPYFPFRVFISSLKQK